MDAELWAEIRRLYRCEGWSKRRLAKFFSLDPRTVRRAILAPHYSPRGKPAPRPSLVDPYKDSIRALLERHPRLSLVRVEAEIRAMGYVGSHTILGDFVRSIRVRGAPEAYLRIDFPPGDAAQVDWAACGSILVEGKPRRLDVAEDRERLADTVAAVRPRLLVVDPFVRLHRIDENASGEVAPLLAYLREVQRACHVGVAVVHHAEKGASSARAGQALRGSSEFHAWGDSNLYLRREGERLTMSVEHRSAAAIAPMDLILAACGKGLALRVTEPPPAPAPTRAPREAIEQALGRATAPMPYPVLREACGMRNSTLWASLGELVAQGRVEKSTRGYALLAK